MYFTTIPNLAGNDHTMLIMIGVDPDITVARNVCTGKHSAARLAKLAFEDGWLGWASPPSFGVFLDQGTACRREFDCALDWAWR